MRKYAFKKEDLAYIYKTIDMVMENRYHELYKQLGLHQGGNGNFHCFEASAHGKGTDRHPSLSINNQTGLYRCHACGIKGNFQSFWRDYLKGRSGGEHYLDFVIDLLNIAGQLPVGHGTDTAEYATKMDQFKKFQDQLDAAYEKKYGRKHMMGEASRVAEKDDSALDISALNDWNAHLLENAEACDYLLATRGITKEMIVKYKLGLDLKNEYFVLPQFNEAGEWVNAKGYNPRTDIPELKWKYFFVGRQVKPVPMSSLAGNKIVFFEGEPDMYCALAFGVDGAFTLGSASNYDLIKAFGSQDRVIQHFKGKEIVIVPDSDSAGRRNAQKLAEQLHPIAKQIKIIDLDKSEMNPNGLDPAVVNETYLGGTWHSKRAEKDYTDFLRKNGFNENAAAVWYKLEASNPVFTLNPDRERKVVCKVSVQEARNPKYYSVDGNIQLETIASVSDLDSNAYLYPTSVIVKCDGCERRSRMEKSGKKGRPGICSECMIPLMPGFTNEEPVEIHMHVKDIPTEHANKVNHIKVDPHDILGLIGVTEDQRTKQCKKLLKINMRCPSVVIADKEKEKLLRVRLVDDVTTHQMSDKVHEPGSADIGIEGFLLGARDIYPNRSYRFKAQQTHNWNDQYAVLFIWEAEPVQTSIEMFQMSDSVIDILQIFRQKPGQTVADVLKHRYKIFGDAAGLTGREDIFLACDLAFFSQAILNNQELLPRVHRGWVEVLIFGDSRCGKSIAAGFLRDHYRLGEYVAGSSATTRSGLLAGVRMFNGKPSISWGKIPMNDMGIVIIDELSNLDVQTLQDMTPSRSDGILDMAMITSGTAYARTAKIMLSNPRVWKTEDARSSQYGVMEIKNFCTKDEVASRFDYVLYVKQSDVPVSSLQSSYTPISNIFTPLQCQTHLKWAKSRKPDQIVYEEGVTELIHSIQNEMSAKFHESTQFVNTEMRAKICRMAISVAAITVSTPDDDYEKIMVRKEHVEFIRDMLMKTYCGPNLQMDIYSEAVSRSKKLGNMDFMANIFKYIPCEPLMQHDDFTTNDLIQIFFDYLGLVSANKIFMTGARDDRPQSRTIGGPPYQNIHKLIGTLVARNCFSRTRSGRYKKTEMFNLWLKDYVRLGDNAPTSDILENLPTQRSSNVNQDVAEFRSVVEDAARRSTAA